MFNSIYFNAQFKQTYVICKHASINMIVCTGWETTLDPPPQAQLQQPQKIEIHNIKI